MIIINIRQINLNCLDNKLLVKIENLLKIENLYLPGALNHTSLSLVLTKIPPFISSVPTKTEFPLESTAVQLIKFPCCKFDSIKYGA